jgi:Zn-dependent protease
VKRSIDLGTAMGVRLRVQPLLLWMLGGVVLWRLLQAGQWAALQTSLELALLMLLVVLHELAHALVARRFGVQVLDITLWPLGGMARLAGMPESPRAETWIALAGPLANFGLALAALPFFAITRSVPSSLPLQGLVLEFVLLNAALGTFNLLPAFPMDGGRVLRAQLARRSGWLLATERAVRVSRVLAFGLLLLGIVWSPMFLLIAAFVLWASWQELAQVRARHAPRRSGLFDLFEFVLRPRPRPRAEEQTEVPRPPRADPAATPEPAGPHRADFDFQPLGKRGISQEDVERLERWRGRLRRTASTEDS